MPYARGQLRSKNPHALGAWIKDMIVERPFGCRGSRISRNPTSFYSYPRELALRLGAASDA